MSQKIFSPVIIGPKEACNRIELAPAGAFLTPENGRTTPEFHAYMEDISRSGAGIVTIGVSDIGRDPLGGMIPWIFSPFFIEDYRQVTETVRKYGALASIELAPVKEMLTPPDVLVNSLTSQQIKSLITLYGDAALRCADAGFDMVMIHGGHGNVPSMFFSSFHNKREDQYGGSFENRCRFGEELVREVKDKVKDRLAVEYRISAEELTDHGMNLEETLQFAQRIEPCIDLLHVSRGLLEKDELLPMLFSPTYFPRGLNLKAAAYFKKNLNIPVSVVGGFDLPLAEEVLESENVDIVAMVRNVLADPLCIEKYREGKTDTIRPCVRCNTCIDSTHSQFKPIRCAVNPLIGREYLYNKVKPAEKIKKILFMGGGPANLEAARAASARGHQSILVEKDETLGGALKFACAAPFKQDMRNYLNWSVRSVMENQNIEVRLATEATPALLKEINPDVMVAAIGSEPIIPDFVRNKENVVWVGDAELNRKPVGQKVVIVGAGFTGLEAALSLLRQGKDVTIIDMIPEEKIGQGGIKISNMGLKQLLQKENARFICEVTLKDVSESGAVITHKDGREEILTCDTVVLSLGVKPNQELIDSLSNLIPETYFIGDCATPWGTLNTAVHAGFDLAMKL